MTTSAKAPEFTETFSTATLALYRGEQVCKWQKVQVFIFEDWAWTCDFKSDFTCTATPIKTDGRGDYILLTAGHCIRFDDWDKYYVSETVEDKPVLQKVEVIKADFSDRYDYALLRFTSLQNYPVIELNSMTDDIPAIGTKLLNVNFSLGVAKQVTEGVVTSADLNVPDLRGRFLTTLMIGPGASGSAVVDAKTHKIVGLVEATFNRGGLGAVVIPTGKKLFHFMEDASAGLRPKAPVGGPPVEPDPVEPEQHTGWLYRIIDWIRGLFHRN